MGREGLKTLLLAALALNPACGRIGFSASSSDGGADGRVSVDAGRLADRVTADVSITDAGRLDSHIRVPDGCTLVRTDTFDDGAPSDEWYPFGEPPTFVTEESGVLTIHIGTSGDTVKFAGYVSAAEFELAGTYVAVEVVSVPSSGNAQILLVFGGSEIVFDDSRLVFRSDRVVLGEDIPFSLVEHRFWRMRHDTGTGTMAWETSPDGTRWTRQRERALDPGTDQPALIGGTYREQTASVVGAFDNFSFGTCP